MLEYWFTNKVIFGSNPVAVTLNSDIALVLRKELLDIHVIRE